VPLGVPPAIHETPGAEHGHPVALATPEERDGPTFADRDGDKKGPFAGVALTGADVYWLAERVRDDLGSVPDLHLEGADLGGAQLEGAILNRTHLEGARLSGAHLERADLSGVHLEGADLSGAHLEGSTPRSAHLEGADLYEAHLEWANLNDAHLEGTLLSGVHLSGAHLYGAHLEGAYLYQAQLEGADLRIAWLDSKTVLSDAVLNAQTKLGDIHWSGVGAVDLTSATWANVPTLGDEHDVGLRSDAAAHEGVVRAYRQLAAQLRAQGMSEVADRFLYRAQVVQRRLLRKLHRYGQWLGSWFLAALAGYGYKPSRTIIWYLATVTAFAVAYYFLGPTQGHTFLPDGALVFSVTSFHGRGFFPENLSFESWVTRLAALEAVTGLLIEISFIATFTQRFFGTK
jgi:uncharacterized protein YjbI with pentapeptide repeats